MTDTRSLNEVKVDHEGLYEKILESSSIIEKKAKGYTTLKREASKLLRRIVELSATELTYNDYRWLAAAAVKWQSVLSITFDTPQVITLAEPSKPWLSTASSVLSENELENWIGKQASFVAYSRIREGQSVSAGKEDDWHLGEIFFALEVIEGRINFVVRIAPQSYWRLTNVWLKDVKCMMAYFRWAQEKNLFCEHERDFLDSCGHIQSLLTNRGMKARIEEFQPVKEYLMAKYIGEDGKLRDIGESPDLRKLIELKAYRISETTNAKESFANWVQAETYVRMFYENIVPAVELDDKEKVLRVLKAFQYSKMNRFIIIDSLEAIIAIYFLKPETIEQLWEESNEYRKRYGPDGKARGPNRGGWWQPESNVESVVEVSSWPTNFELHCGARNRFWFNDKQIHFKGVMLEQERESIKGALAEASPDGIREEHEEALNALYIQSRLIYRETTL